MKAIDAVENLKKLADLLEKHPGANIHMASATVWFAEKNSFLSVARDFPRPFRKGYTGGSFPDLDLDYGTLNEDGEITLRIPQAGICRLVEPAKPARYECDPILSADEEAQLEGAQ